MHLRILRAYRHARSRLRSPRHTPSATVVSEEEAWLGIG